MFTKRDMVFATLLLVTIIFATCWVFRGAQVHMELVTTFTVAFPFLLGAALFVLWMIHASNRKWVHVSGTVFVTLSAIAGPIMFVENPQGCIATTAVVYASAVIWFIILFWKESGRKVEHRSSQDVGLEVCR